MSIQYTYDADLKQSMAYDGSKQVGFCRYEVQGNTWTIYTTHVLDEYGGQGIAKKLVLIVEQEAKKQEVQLKATCWYAAKVLRI
ncbi:MAG: GNAT family N-acetyltransferase [Erysipelotrichaceae bacterium]|nr:GNAT family N-acetyltransferase [Erysipelotrichaceae bacterium]